MFSVALLLLLAAGSCVKCQTLTQPASLTVRPGQSLTITCQVSYDVDSDYTAWIRQPAGKALEAIGHEDAIFKDSLKNKFSISLDSSSKTSTLTGQNLQPEDTAVYYCARERGYSWGFDYWGKGTTVTVSSATSTSPTVFPLVQCGPGTGDTVTLGCLATGFTPASLTFAWTGDSGATLTDIVQYPAVQKDSLYSAVSQVKVTRADWDGKKKIYCKATNAAGSNSTTIDPQEQGPKTPADQTPPSLTTTPPQTTPPPPPTPTLNVLSSPPLVVEEEKTASFSCFAIGFASKVHEIKWLKDGQEITNKISEFKTPATESKKTAKGPLFSTASYLTVKDSEWTKGTTFTCVFKQHEINVNKSVSYSKYCPNQITDDQIDIKIIPISLEEMFRNKKSELVCEVQENDGQIPSIEWQDGTGKTIVANNKSQSVGKGKIHRVAVDVLYEEWNKGIKYYCVVDHPLLFEPKRVLYERENGGELKRPAVFLLPPVEQTRNNTVTLTCYVKDFYPKEVVVSWLVDDVAADSKLYAFNTTNLIENNGFYSVYAQLSFSLDQWKYNDAVYSCVVYHESLMDTPQVIMRSVVESRSEKANLVNLNIDLPQSCKA